MMKPGVLLFTLLFALEASSQTDFDIQPTHAGPVQYLTPGTHPLILSVKNNDINYPVTFFESYWQLDNGPVHACTIDGNVMVFYDMLYPSYFANSFTHCDSLVVNEAGTYELKTWTGMPEGNADTNPANDTLYTTIHVADFLPEKKVMMFMGTHTDCFPCGGMGEEQQNLVLGTFPDNLFLVTMHGDVAEDPFDTEESEAFNDTYIWPYTGHPAFLFDLYTFPFFGDVISTFYWDQTEAVEWRLPYQSPLEVEFENIQFDNETSVLSGDLRTTFHAPYDGPLSVNVILSEDSIWWYQNGYPLGDSLYHRFVMRDLTDGVFGNSTIIPADANDGDEFVYSFATTVSPEWNFGQLYLAGYVQKNSGNVLTNEILNAAQVRVTEAVNVDVSESFTASHSMQVYPNPARGVLHIRYAGHSNRLFLTNALGQCAREINAYKKELISEEVGALPSGIYLLHDGQGSTAKVEIRK